MIQHPLQDPLRKKTQGGNYKIDPSRYDDVVKMYVPGVSHREIAARCGVNKQLVAQILKGSGLKGRANKQYALTEDWLSAVDSPDKAYFLGYFWADGNMQKDGRTCKITLQEKDMYILETFRDWLYPDGNRPLVPDFHDYKKYAGKRAKKYALKISSRRFWNDLKSLGCMPAKSLVIDFPKMPTDELAWHFVRGVFDGDGSISRIAYGRFTVSWIGSRTFCKGLSSFLKAKGIYSKIEKKGNVSVVRVHRIGEIKSIFAPMYSNSSGRRLSRKFDLFFEASKQEYKIRFIRLYSRSTRKLVREFVSCRDCALFLNRSVSSVRSCYGGRSKHPDYIISRKGYHD